MKKFRYLKKLIAAWIQKSQIWFKYVYYNFDLDILKSKNEIKKMKTKMSNLNKIEENKLDKRSSTNQNNK